MATVRSASQSRLNSEADREPSGPTYSPPGVPIALVPAAPDAPAGQAVRAAIADGLKRLLASERSRAPDAAPADPETTHQMRVATRRLRSDLRTFGPLLDPVAATALVEELRWLGRVLGDLREADVRIARLERDAASLPGDRAVLTPLFDALERRRVEARRRVAEALTGPRHAALVSRLAEAVHTPRLSLEAARACRDALPPLVAAAWKRLAKAARALGRDSLDADLHEVRIRAKRTRYAAEAVAIALAPEPAEAARRFAARVTKLQDLLGEHQDAVTAAHDIAELAATLEVSDPAFERAAERLAACQNDAARAARKRFPRLWKKLDRKKHRRWFRCERH